MSLLRQILGILVLAGCVLTASANANDYYTHGSFPATGSAATSAGMRAELDLISAGFDKLPSVTGNANRAVIVNGAGTALGLTTGTLTLPGNFALSGVNNVTLTTTGATNVTLPTTGTLATVSGALGTPTSITLTNATGLPLSTGITGFGAGVATFLATPSSANFATAVTGETGSGALVFGTNPAIDGPTLSNTLAGTYTIGGTPTLGASLAAGGNDITGLDELGFNNASADATASGRLRRNGGALTWHDGSAASPIITANTVVRNPITNGNMEVWQRTSPLVNIANAYAADQFKVMATGAAIFDAQQAVGPPLATAGVLLESALEVSDTTADASIAATDTYSIRHYLSGYNWRHFAQRETTLSFLVYSSKSGIHTIALRNAGPDRYYIAEYTVNSANTWQRVAVTIPASPSAGTWNYNNNLGVEIIWNLACGSNFHGTTSSWSTGSAYCTANQVNVVDTIFNLIRITGVKMELGSVATPIQYIPYEEELERCRVYFQKSFEYPTAPASNVGLNTGEFRFHANAAGAVANTSPSITFSPRMRGSPSIQLYNPAAGNLQVRNVTDSADHTSSGTANSTERGFVVTHTGLAGTAIGENLAVHWTASSEF